MKKALFLAAAVAGMTTTASAGDFYVKGGAGYTFGNTQDYGVIPIPFNMDGDIAFGGAIGLANLLGPIALEIDVFRTSRQYTGFITRLESTSIMADLVLRKDDFIGPVGIYAGGGVGMINVRYDGSTAFPAFTGKDWQFGYQALAGLELGLGSSPANLFGEWRFQNASDASIVCCTVEYSAHSVTMGVRFEF